MNGHDMEHEEHDHDHEDYHDHEFHKDEENGVMHQHFENNMGHSSCKFEVTSGCL